MDEDSKLLRGPAVSAATPRQRTSFYTVKKRDFTLSKMTTEGLVVIDLIIHVGLNFVVLDHICCLERSTSIKIPCPFVNVA